MKNIAIILAGGTGDRLGHQEPKQFIKVAGKMIIEHTIEVFQKHPRIDEIFVVVHSDYMEMTKNLVIRNQFSKVKKFIKGGAERSDSSIAAVNAADEEANLLFHDAVRPFVNDRIIDDIIDALKTYNAVALGMPATDTIHEVSNGFISNIPDRSKFRKAQSPQSFKLPVIKEAYEIAIKDPFFKATDECGVVKKYLPEEKILVLKGEESNFKITYAEDLYLADKLLQMRSREASKNYINNKNE
jgi:2-C-methyl-D-erythritol 4-phosphate cytidylyltransferase